MKVQDSIKREKIFAFLFSLFAAWFLFPFFFEAAVFPVPSSGPSWLTLDPSWKITINKANIDKLTWGEDFTLTYGPLSYLSTRVGWGANRFHFLLFDIFITLNFLAIFYRSYVKSANKKITVLLIASSVLLLPVFFGAGTSIILFAFLVYWLIESLQSNKFYVYFMQTAILLLLFFIKFNTGLVSFVLFILCILFRFFSGQGNKIRLVIYLIAPFLLVFPAAALLHVSLFSYIRGGLEMVSGYNEIMYLNEPYQNEFYFALFCIALSFLYLFYFLKTSTDKRKNVMIAAIYNIVIFVLYKQAFTRMDIQHVLDFYKYFLLFLLCFQVFHQVKINENTNAIVIGMVFFTMFFAKKREENFMETDQRFSKAGYISGFKYFNYTSGLYLFPNNNQFPQHIKSKVGKSTIDIYPWNTHALLENRLNYKPRPVFQSYTTYTPYLQKLNFNYYNSASAPQFVVYDFDAIDGRYPLFDEPKLNMILLKNYICADTFSFAGRKQLLLERDKNNKPIKLQKIKEYKLNIQDKLIPQPAHFYEVEISNNLEGIFLSFFVHAPEINIRIKTKDGNIHSFRSSKKLLEGGIFSNYFFSSTTDIYDFMKNKAPFKPENEIVNIGWQPATPGFFQKAVVVKEYIISKSI